MTLAQMRALLQRRQEELTANNDRLAEIATEVRGLQGDDAGVARLGELNTEVNTLEERNTSLQAEISGLEAQIERAANTAANGQADLHTIESRGIGANEQLQLTDVETVVASEEYRRAWLRNLAVDRDGNRMFGEMSEAEQRAFTFTTANTGSVVPTITQNRIIDRMRHEAPMLADATVTAINQGFAIPVRTAIAAGDAAPVAQDAANSDEQDTFTLITMTGVDIKKHIVMTRRMQFQSIEAFEDWLVADITRRIMVAKETVIRARLDGSAPSASDAANTGVAIAEGNVLTGQTYADSTIRAILAKINEPGQVVVYANRYTIYNGLMSIKDTNDRPLFINSTVTDDPMVKGSLYGAAVKEDVNLSNNVAYFGIKGSLKANNFAPLEVIPAIEPKTANRIWTGSEIFDAGLENPEAFVKVTFTTGG